MNETNELYIAIRAAVDAGRVIMDIYQSPVSDFDVESKADNSPLTKADKASHRLIAERLSVTPYPILSEEGQHLPFEERSLWKDFWLVDPLDGTKEFIKKNGEFTVNIALVREGVPVMGVVYIPVREELYFSTDALGAYKLTFVGGDGCLSSFETTLEASTRLPMHKEREDIVVVASRSHCSAETMAFIDNLQRFERPVTLISSGSSRKICLVAEGSADVYPRFAPTMEWDTAAGHAIARGAGCDVFHTDGKTPLTYNKEDFRNPWFIVKSYSSEY